MVGISGISTLKLTSRKQQAACSCLCCSCLPTAAGCACEKRREMVDAVGIGPLPSSPNWRGVLLDMNTVPVLVGRGNSVFFSSLFFFSLSFFPFHFMQQAIAQRERPGGKLCEGVDLGR